MFVNSSNGAITLQLPASFKIPYGVTDLTNAFYSMSLVNVPFLIPETVTNMYSTFGFSVNMQSIPADFKFPAGVTSLRNVFSFCRPLSADISNIFPEEWQNGGYTCNLQGTFANATNITGTVPAWLFDGRNNFTFNADTFKGCKKLTNYNEIPASWGGGGA